ncbi:biotin-dependent carboxyltransferase family protein [Ancylobacter sp. WKF20]|uniref:5-oxoprolinase subunit C family protein n=1 Tax=Ancylobacter sp. WKF20 TaxID=3039801 RepID=UPI0024342D64|nr:biotin-dependent carboxyltransferase family protein [Ancylobacter sp. WKF20]WGD30713.1 biotin-dependent carboxyltransferase family protein [Ancylobacter sp. WKF20]
MSTLRILQPGPQTSVQDLGRRGFQAFGVPVCGALDPVALRLANALVGNAATDAALELRLAGPHFVVEDGSARIALAGASARIEVIADGETRAYPSWRAIDVPEGATVRIGALTQSGCAILAVAGGMDVPAVMGSRATDLKGRFGGVAGRALISGDMIPVSNADPSGPCLDLPHPPTLAFAGTLRVVLGPQAEAFTEAARATFLTAAYRVSREADRMGMRLDGPPLGFVTSADIVSDGIATGSIQVPGSGLPILLLADHQTIGGYAKIATVISADLPAAGRLLPGAELRFAAVSVAEAEAARRAQEQAVARLVASLAPVREGARIDTDALWRANLISGVVSAYETE